MIRKFLDVKCNRGVRASLVSGSAVQPQLRSHTFSIFRFRKMDSSSFPRQQQGGQHQLHAGNSWKATGNAPSGQEGFKVATRTFGGAGAGAGAGLQNCQFQFGSFEPDDLLPPHSATNENNGVPEIVPSPVVPVEAQAPTLDGVNRDFTADGKNPTPSSPARSSGATEREAPTAEKGEDKEILIDGGKAESPVTDAPTAPSSEIDTGKLSSTGAGSIVNSAAVPDESTSPPRSPSPAPLERQESPVENNAAVINSSESDGPGTPKGVASAWNSSSSPGMNGREPARVSPAMPNSRPPPPPAEPSVFGEDDFPVLGAAPLGGGKGRGGRGGAPGGGGYGGAVKKAGSFGGRGAASSSVPVQAQQQQQAHPPAGDPSKSQQPSPSWGSGSPITAGKLPAESSRGIHGVAGTGVESGSSDARRGGGGGGGGAGNRRQSGGGDERRSAAGQRHGSPNARGGKGGDPIDALDRLLTRILRHQAVELGLKMRSDGFVSVKEVLKLQMKTRVNKSLSAYTVDDVLEAVKIDNKQRLGIKTEDGELFIRANQGHSMESVETEQLLKPILTANDIPGCVHGTYVKYLDAIFDEGLKKMTRRHVHFATGLYGTSDVISGMRSSCEVLVHLDVEKALADGMKLYISENGVVLTEGFNGVIPPEYFAKVLRLPNMKPIIPRSKQSTKNDSQ